MIRIFTDSGELDIQFMTFSGGERNVKIKGYKPGGMNSLKGPTSVPYGDVRQVDVHAHIDSSDTLMDLLLLKDALNRIHQGVFRNAYMQLHLPYIPYARQDRPMVDGEALSCVVFANLINALEFDTVVVDDPHSDVVSSHIKNVVINEQPDLAEDILGSDFFEEVILIAPDAGAMKKTMKLAQIMGVEEVGVGGKIRNVQTGQITGTSYNGPNVEGRSVLMVDDICDRGGTFVQLAAALKKLGAEEIILYVTHGIFAAGIDEPFDGLIDRVYAAYYWKKNIEGKNEKGIFKIVDTSTAFV